MVAPFFLLQLLGGSGSLRESAGEGRAWEARGASGAVHGDLEYPYPMRWGLSASRPQNHSTIFVRNRTF